MDNRVYWIWLAHAFGPGSSKPWSIYNRFQGGVREFYDCGAPLWNSMDFVTEKEARLLYSFSLRQAEVLLELSEKMAHKVMTPECEKYPDALRHIFDPPAVLYYRGEVPDTDNTPAIAVVGARKASEKAVSAAMTFGYQLALSSAVVVSGGALGVDTAAHKGALRAMGKTICVLPCGLTNGYLVENYALRERIAEEGLLLTEYPMDTGVQKGTFQVRNRILSGLCCGTLIVEAAKRSGALITAKHAKEQNRDVFAFPGAPGDPKAGGSNALIEDGAKPVKNADMILDEYAQRFSVQMPIYGSSAEILIEEKEPADKSLTVKSSKGMPVMAEPAPEETDYAVSENAKQVLSVIAREPVHISEITGRTNMRPAEILAAVTELELAGFIKSHAGRRYSR